MRIVCLMCAMASYTFGASAEEPTVVNEPGKPIALVFASGNRAELRLARPQPFAVPVEFEVSKNDCTASIGHKLEVKLGIRLDVYSWIWIQHSDSTKVNNEVNYKRPDGSISVLNLGMIMSNGSRYIASDAANGLPPDEISFTDGVKWIPGLEDGVFRKFTIESWNSEAMIPNPQTGQNQNRISSGEFGIGFSPDGGGVRGLIDHTQRGAFFTSFEEHGFYMLGDVVTWNFRTAPTVMCQIAFKPNVGKASDLVTAYIGTIKYEFKPMLGKQEGMADVMFNYFRESARDAIE